MKKLYKESQRFKSWTLVKYIDSGGNGEVWHVVNTNGQRAVIKILKKIAPKAYKRFCDEITVVINNSDIQGILPIIDYSLPLEITNSTSWYVMPEAIPLSKFLNGQSVEQIVESMFSVTKTLSELHKRKIYHRDIKPPNLFHFNNQTYLGDFGLVDYPHKSDLTVKGEAVGPKWTIAPEMKRNPDKASGASADVYSLAKTLWMFLTKDFKGFEGQYSTDSVICLKRYLESIPTIPLDKLLFAATDNDPNKRPSIEKFAEELNEWILVNKDRDRRNNVEWNDIQKRLFPVVMPTRAIWENVDGIISILNMLAESKDSINHVFMPDGGGSDLTGATRSWEADCIELDFGGSCCIVKPNRLLLETFGVDPQWNYFRLETKKLEPVNETASNSIEQVLTEIEPGVYTDYECWEFNDFNAEELPKTARRIRRYISGNFVIFLDVSAYNRDASTYDGRHNKMSTDEFRNYIERQIRNRVSAVRPSITPVYVKPTSQRMSKRKLEKNELNLIKEVINLAEASKNEDLELKSSFGIDLISLNDKRSLEFLSSPRPKEEELEKFLKTLSDDEIILLSALMQGGREYMMGGRTYPLECWLEDETKFNSKKNLIQYLLDKGGKLADYLKAALEAFK